MLSKINETTFQQFTWSIEKSRKDAQISQRLSIIGPILCRQEVCPVEWNSEHPPRLEQIEELFLIPSIAFLSTPVCNNNPFVAAGIATPLSLAFYSTPSLPFWQWVSSFLGQFGEVSIYDQARGCIFATTALFCSACVFILSPQYAGLYKRGSADLARQDGPPLHCNGWLHLFSSSARFSTSAMLGYASCNQYVTAPPAGLPARLHRQPPMQSSKALHLHSMHRLIQKL